ncbi:hypothetical protein BV25DRAFT_520979 [Artomyces pyxidatus]|uniref:Uncharacterized protein n=1 Tax=Artomyces pyxidatus TaxID=48021 RepID=A0ACB8TI20_9AGAM|nr:hypothetical protein BV25DRAFT_520979 [Artomyces pyxidatus]
MPYAANIAAGFGRLWTTSRSSSLDRVLQFRMRRLHPSAHVLAESWSCPCCALQGLIWAQVTNARSAKDVRYQVVSQRDKFCTLPYYISFETYARPLICAKSIRQRGGPSYSSPTLHNPDQAVQYLRLLSVFPETKIHVRQ